MKEIREKLELVYKDKALRRKILFIFFILFLFRLFVFIPVPVVDLLKLKALFTGSQFLSLLDIFSGGTLINFSVMALGLNPYINASIIMQLLTTVVPQFEELSKEGEYGRFKINQYTRFLTLPLTFLQSIGIYALLKNQKIIISLTPLELISFMTTLIAGTFILMWFGELISEFGLGNGISILIFAGIIARLPVTFFKTFSVATQETAINLIIFLILSLVIIVAIVFVSQAVRKIPVYYAKRIRGNRMYQAATNFLPLKLNQAGVIPIIFAVSFVLFPQLIGNFFSYSKNQFISGFAKGMANIFNPAGFTYNFFYFILVVGFTFFYTFIVFNPQKISEEIQKQGGFIPGIRPGVNTKKYLEQILYRITSVGAVFLGLVAILPVLIARITNVNSFIIGGTGMLIIVEVVLETFKNIEAQMVMKGYDKYM